MTQPTRSPRFATDALYTSGADNGLATKAVPSTGFRAQGLRRDRHFPAARMNSLLADHGEFLESIVDAPALTWTHATEIGEDMAGSFGLGLARSHITRLAHVDAVGYEGQDLLLGYGQTVMYLSRDGHSWPSQGPHGLDSSTGRGFAAGLMADGTTYAIIGWNQAASGAVRKTLDFGATWAAAGDLTAGMSTAAGSVGAVHPVSGRFFILEGGGSQLFYSDTLANATWSSIDLTSVTTTSVSPDGPAATSPTTLAFIGGAGSAQKVVWSDDGATWNSSSFPGTASIAGLHWSTSHDVWIALQGNRNVYTAPAGFSSWTLRSTPDFGSVQSSGRVINSIGRTVLICVGTGIFASRDLANWRRLSPTLTEDGISPDAWLSLEQLNGRIYAHRQFASSGTVTNSAEYCLSGALPALFSEGPAW